MHKLLAVFLLLTMLCCTLTYGAGGKKKPAILRRDSSSISIKKFDDEAIKSYKKDKEFNYTDGASKEGLSWWALFWMWVWALISSAVNSSPLAGIIITWVLPTLGILGLLYLILRSVNLLKTGPKKSPLAYYEALENIHEIDFDSEIENAIAQYNYRLAVRLLYLKCLKQLSDAGLIHWQIDKTNSAYYNELSNPEQRSSFRMLTHRFEYVWYGGFAVDERAFNDINGLFQQFKKELP